MINAPLYKVDNLLKQVCIILKISPDLVLRRAKLPNACLSSKGKGISAEEYFTLWSAIEQTYGKDDLAMRAGIATAHGGFAPAFFSFSCSPDIRTGLRRLVQFKPLVGPLTVATNESDDKLAIEIRPIREDLTMPESMAHCEMVLFLELFRTQTAEPIQPLDFTLPAPGKEDTSFFGMAARRAKWPSLTISIEDAMRPLVCENAEMWSMFEPQLRRQLAETVANATVIERLRNELFEAIPSGETTVAQLASRLHMSKRSLQRHLREEDASFQAILDKTRSELAKYYLNKTSIPLSETSFLLGYENTASFSRAFRKWFGKSPSEFKSGQRVQ